MSAVISNIKYGPCTLPTSWLSRWTLCVLSPQGQGCPLLSHCACYDCHHNRETEMIEKGVYMHVLILNHYCDYSRYIYFRFDTVYYTEQNKKA